MEEVVMSATDQQVSCSGAISPNGLGMTQVCVEFLYLDLTTCERCRATDSSLRQALDALSGAFAALGYDVRLSEVNITSRELAIHHRFLSSPTIRVNGVDIQVDVKESECADCGSLSGCATDCRVFTWRGVDVEQPPAGMIVDGILRALYSEQTPDETPYRLPENLDRYFTGLQAHAHPSKKGTMMTSIHVYEPALCCNTGVCGPDPEQALVQFTADIAAIAQLGGDVIRHNLANDPLAFAQAEPVAAFMRAAGSDGLPLTTVDGAVVLTGRYPSRDELARYAGLATASDGSGCCGGSTDSSCGCGSQGAAVEPTCDCGAPAQAAAATSRCGCGSTGCC